VSECQPGDGRASVDEIGASVIAAQVLYDRMSSGTVNGPE
jgi:hypothetical protein